MPRDAGAVRDALRPIEHELLPEAVRADRRGGGRVDPDHPRRVLFLRWLNRTAHRAEPTGAGEVRVRAR